MKIKTFVISGMETNCYVITDEESKKSIIVDPGGNLPGLKDYVNKENISLEAIVLTHAHYDHTAGIEAIVDEYNIPIICGKNEELVLEEPNYNLSPLFSASPLSLKADKLLEDNEEFMFGGLKFKTFFTPGHTPGGICLYFENENVLISGDTLFAGSVGRTDFPGGDWKALMSSVKDRLLTLPEETLVFPGHGPKTTIENEKKYNPYF